MSVSRINQICCRKLFTLQKASKHLVVLTQYCREVHTDPRRHQHTQASSFEGATREFDFPFARARLGTFVQEAPVLGNQYLEDATLQSYLKRHVPEHVLGEIEPDLVKFGKKVATEMYDLSLQCEKEQPYVEKFTGWGNLVDKLVTGPAWKRMHDISAEEGLIAISYERKYREYSRLYGLVKNYLNAPSSGLYSCPLAMTDGAAKIIEGLQDVAPWLMDKAYPRLTSRDPALFWTSGQWMTEKRGGSDVANGTETVAVEQRDGTYRLYGYKWFSSATDADITFTLARVVDRQGNTIQGTKGLSLFYMEVHNEDGSLNNMEIIRLKNKLGTRQLPTAELLLDGCTAFKVSDKGRGVPAISNMLKLTRIHNSIAAAATMRRMVNMSRDYSTRRSAFGNLLKTYPLHLQTLARMEVEVRGAVILCLENMRLLGKEDVSKATEDEQNLLRLLVPLSKLYSGKQALQVGTEGLESFGGQGYIEDTGIPAMLRDAQVLSIWEGTTNILSLDVLRAIAKSKGQVLSSFSKDINARMSEVRNEHLAASASRVTDACEDIMKFIQDNTTKQNVLEMAARDLAFSLCRTYTGALLIDHACSEVGSAKDVYVAQRWCEKELALVKTNAKLGQYSEDSTKNDFDLVFECYHDKDRL
ncbi:acyl-CoA dehydrogenase family member 11-like isoform X1 [Mercenaria mercenaria]|uniref:acyl-CoA dehydrogenase family member 11-like isoform X1 n=1 Tax=Mercenaria mercenaria TaxID=6596 RepID=UPI00234ECBB5|nr:acyl-CoA dehydrogenase family member 11-like isoform X1 [Mercenaria mercenaria]XP_045209175.2 acyl-CoA dehydrogenase family member 11-like isoform X1 [Mercenaria mercenaria]XP_053372528.1 acyl-CoA dehydrogenase family member 11-like isoform X1 [Mercenaria mercenaria]